MNRMSRFAVCAATVMMIAFVPVRMVWSADDSASVAQVYLEFDPATGEFKSVPATPANSPDGSMMYHKSKHAAQTDTQQNTSQQTTTPPAQPASTSTADNSGAAQRNSSPVIIGAVVALVLVGGVVLTLRKKTA